MFLTAGYAVGKASGTTWQDFVEKRIFEPIGMTSTDASVAVAEKAADHASPHLRTDGKTGVIPWYHLDNIQPAGGINSNVRDLARWVQFQLGDGTWRGKRLISARNMAEMHTPQMAMRPEDWGRNYNPETHLMSYAMAWELQDYRGLHMISHGGAIDGFRANITLLPDQKTGIVVLSNLNQENMPEALRFTLIDIAMDLKERDWDSILMEHFANEEKQEAAETKKFVDSRVPNTKPALELEAYAGEYVEPAYGTAVISLDSGRLMLRWSNFRQPLDHFHFDTFRVHDGRLEGVPVQFRLSANGGVSGMDFLGVKFEKRSSEHR
jgi:CubicO group peptidase (beta-lactamase class C family)